jgi:hypothetical protein
MLAVVPADMQYHDSMFVVAHFHYVLMPGAVFGLFAGVFYWLPKWTGHMYNERLAKIFFWVNVISFNVTFFPQHFLGLAGMPRRIVDYNVMFTEFNVSALMQGDSAAEAAYFGKALGGPGAKGWMTPNEVRRLKNLPPLPGGDVIATQNAPAPAPAEEPVS